MRLNWSFWLLLLLPVASLAQLQTVRQTNAWVLASGDVRFSKNWSVYYEIQPRFAGPFEGMQQFLVRPGIHFHGVKGLKITAGYGFIETWPYGGQPVAARFPEHRFWEQVSFTQTWGRVQFFNRMRMEQRLLGVMVADSAGDFSLDHFRYANRFRYMGRIFIPLNKKSVEKGALLLAAYDEFFIAFGKQLGGNVLFDQNRLFLGLGYMPTADLTLQAGYVHHYLQKSDGVRREVNRTPTLMATWNFDLRKSQE